MKVNTHEVVVIFLGKKVYFAAPDLDGGALGPRSGGEPMCGYRIFR